MFGIAASSHAQQKIEKVELKIEKCKMKKREARGNGKESRIAGRNPACLSRRIRKLEAHATVRNQLPLA
jgi:hypothetical protein